jgi:hypothetical protein
MMRWDRPALTVGQILAWADAHRARTGRWPSQYSGPVEGAPGETWVNVHQALQRGLRGLPGGDTLARLLARERGKRYPRKPPPLTEGRIVTWARAHRKATERWPTAESGPVAGAPGETWHGLDGALRKGSRGLPGGDTLARLLARRVGKPHPHDRPPLTVAHILAWADAHRARAGEWPGVLSGPIPEAPGESWKAVNLALYVGFRGLPGGDSLARLLRRRRRLGKRRGSPPGGGGAGRRG